ncbi:hypothetical protein ACW7BJ_16130 [Azospirillum argentinense]
MARRIVKYSGGTGSWGAAKREALERGTDGLTLLFTDVLMEDGDLYRFLIESACNIFGETPPTQLLQWWKTVPEFHEDKQARKLALETLRADMAEVLPQLVWIADGRDPWEVFRAERMLGSSRLDPCSKKLKRELADRWLRENVTPSETMLVFGIDWTEIHRFDDGAGHGVLHRWGGKRYQVRAPLCESPMMSKADVNRWCLSEGMALPRLTALGFAHNNCSGMCVKAGQSHYAHLLRVFPDRYAFYEAQEEGFRQFIARDVAMMKEQIGKDAEGNAIYQPLPLKALRERIQAGQQIDLFDHGGCGCFVDDERDAA